MCIAEGWCTGRQLRVKMLWRWLSDLDVALAPLSITVGCDFSWLENCGRGPTTSHLAVRTPPVCFS